MLAGFSKSEELISKVAFDFSEVNVIFAMPLFQWYEIKRATSVSSATTLTLLPISSTCTAHQGIYLSASSLLFITLFPDLIK